MPGKSGHRSSWYLPLVRELERRDKKSKVLSHLLYKDQRGMAERTTINSIVLLNNILDSRLGGIKIV